MPDVGAIVKKPSVALKIVELLLGIVSIALVIDGYQVGNTFPAIATIYGTQIGFVMISLILVMSYLMETPLHNIIVLIVCCVGGIMWMITGGLIIEFYVDYRITVGGVSFRLADRLIVSGGFAVVNAFVFCYDAGRTLRGLNSTTPSTN